MLKNYVRFVSDAILILFLSLCITEVVSISILKLVLSGDVETNPGPPALPIKYCKVAVIREIVYFELLQEFNAVVMPSFPYAGIKLNV